MSINKLNNSLTPTIFHESWWLDISMYGRAEVVEYKSNGQVFGRLPFFKYRSRKNCMTYIAQPTLTPFLGPAIIDEGGKPANRFLRRLEITTELMRQLPPVSSVYIKCYRDITEGIAFQSEGFQTAVQFTSEILPQPGEVTRENMHRDTRSAIRAAREKHSVTHGNDPEKFMAFYNQNIENEGKQNYLDLGIIGKLVGAAIEHKRGRIYEARDHKADLVASLFCAWDQASMYYLLTTRTKDAHKGTTNLLVEEAVSDAARMGLIFDFGGVSSKGSAKTANNFGATFVPRYIVTKDSAAMSLYQGFQSMRTQKRSFY